MTTEAFSSNKPYLFRAIYQWIVDNDATPHILVDASYPSVAVPNEYVQQGKIILNAAPEAIKDWYADNDAVSFSARFAGKAQDIYLPIGSILAIYAQENNLGMAFQEESSVTSSEPEETGSVNFSSQLEEERELKSTSKTTDDGKSKPKKASHLKVIK